MSFIRRTNFPGSISHPRRLSDPIEKGIHASDVPWINYDVYRWEKTIAISAHFHAFCRHVLSADDGRLLAEK